MKNIIFFLVLIAVVACGTEDTDIAATCVAFPRGEVNMSKVNLTSARIGSAYLNDQSSEPSREDTVEYAISDVKFTLNGSTRTSSREENEFFSTFTQFDVEEGFPVMEYQINGQDFSYDPNSRLVQYDLPQLQPGVYIYYIIIEDFEAKDVTVIVEEWENYTGECNDTPEF